MPAGELAWAKSDNKFHQSMTRYGAVLKKINLIITTWINGPGAGGAATCDFQKHCVFESFWLGC